MAGLLALMLLHDARRASRETADGRLVPLAEQDRSLWDRQRINEGCSIVEWALQHGPLGPYQVQAAIAALHADAETAESTDWKQISLLYGMLERLAPSAWVELNRAVAIAEVRGPAEGLRLLDQLEASGDLAGVHRLPAARAHLLQRLGRTDEAAEAFERALELAPNEPERAYLRERLALLSPSRPG